MSCAPDRLSKQPLIAKIASNTPLSCVTEFIQSCQLSRFVEGSDGSKKAATVEDDARKYKTCPGDVTAPEKALHARKKCAQRRLARPAWSHPRAQ